MDELPILHSPELQEAAEACPLLDGDHEAWINCCSRRFLPIAKRITRGNGMAEDTLQESWIRILQSVNTYRGGVPACAWVRAVVTNCAKDTHLRARNAAETPFGDSEDLLADSRPDPESQAQELEMLGLLFEMLQMLPPVYQEVFDKRYIQGLSNTETAAELHISRTAVSTRLNRAVSMIRRRIKTRLEHGSSSSTDKIRK